MMVSFSRLKREDCKRTKHDSVFSPWKILIGPSDWENYFVGKDGAEKYRIHNLPNCSCPGLYELGIATLHTNLGRDIRKLDQDRIVVVYLGQADNVRNRLQEYGRRGSHLEHGNSFGCPRDDKSSCQSNGLGLFTEIFSRGFPIVFRWAPMENKKAAERTESQLLDIFDYAWNKGRNGSRRPNDVHLKLDAITSRNISFIIARNLKKLMRHRPFVQKQGITIKVAIPPPSSENLSSTCRNRKIQCRPRIITGKCDVKEDISIFELSSYDDSVCSMKPTEGRKRWEEHKLKSNNGGLFSVCTKAPIHRRTNFELPKENSGESKLPYEDLITVCGVALGDGSVCKNRPVERRKRCTEHKGRRRRRIINEFETQGKFAVCNVGLEDGSVCMEATVPGRKRCEVHKGRRRLR